VDGITLVEVVAFFIGRWQKNFPDPAPVRAHAAGFFAGKTGKAFRR
jgi:hypothetical protein